MRFRVLRDSGGAGGGQADPAKIAEAAAQKVIADNAAKYSADQQAAEQSAAAAEVTRQNNAERNKRWAETMDKDPEAAEYFRQHLAGKQLTESEARIAALEQKLADDALGRVKDKLQIKYKLEDQDVEDFLTASEPEKLEQQAKRVAERLAAKGGNGKAERSTGGDAGATGEVATQTAYPGQEKAGMSEFEWQKKQFRERYDSKKPISQGGFMPG
jgi:hypothetical protein